MIENLAQISTSVFPSLPPILCKGGFVECFFFVFERILVYTSILAMAFSALMIAWAGFLYMSQPEKSKEIHQRIIWAVVGLVIALLSFALVKLISALLGAFLVNFVFAQSNLEFEVPQEINCGGVKIPSIFETSSLPLGSWSSCFVYLIYLALSLLYKAVFVASVIMLIWTGFNYIAKPEKAKELHKNFVYIAIGIIIAFTSFTIVKLIESFFFNLT